MNMSDSMNPYLPWSLRELRIASKGVVKQKLMSLSVCLFIDGLDEYSGNHEEIVELFETIISSSANKQTNLKACITSRPLTVFEHDFRHHRRLKVQHLTDGDIWTYVSTALATYGEMNEDADKDVGRTIDLVNAVVRKASGVFLWVRLVVTSLGEGLRDRDRLSELQARVSEIPQDLEGFTSACWEISNLDTNNKLRNTLKFCKERAGL